MGTYLGGAEVRRRLLASSVAGSTPEQRRAWLARARELATTA